MTNIDEVIEQANHFNSHPSIQVGTNYTDSS